MIEDLLLNIYEFLSVIIPFLIVFGIFKVIYKRKRIEMTRGHFGLLFIFAVYIFGVFYFTGAGTIFDAWRYGLEAIMRQTNFIPFSSPGIDIVAYLLNIILFVPLGFLAPLIWPNLNKIKYAFLAWASFSLLIELSQLLNYRSTDVDDLLMNTFGAIIGYLLFRIFSRLTKRSDKVIALCKYEVVFYILAMFVGRFLTFNEFGLAKIIYGF
ncbi:MAG: VanZ family protein [Candidatus Omnitrophota bacterium]